MQWSSCHVSWFSICVVKSRTFCAQYSLLCCSWIESYKRYQDTPVKDQSVIIQLRYCSLNLKFKFLVARCRHRLLNFDLSGNYAPPLISKRRETSACSACHHCVGSIRVWSLGCENLSGLRVLRGLIEFFCGLGWFFSTVLRFLVDPNAPILYLACMLNKKDVYLRSEKQKWKSKKKMSE